MQTGSIIKKNRKGSKTKPRPSAKPEREYMKWKSHWMRLSSEEKIN